MRILAVYQLKGGVGKTAAAVNLATLAAKARIPTLLWDLDPQGAASWILSAAEPAGEKPKALWTGSSPAAEWVQATERPNLSLIPASLSSRHLDTWLRKDDVGALKALLKPLSEQFSLVVLDCPPSLSHLAENILAAAHVVLMPTVPAQLSLRSLKQVLDYCKEHGLARDRLLPFWSLADRRRALHKLLIDEPPKTMPKPARAVIPYSAVVERMGEKRAPLHEYDAEHPAAEAYKQLWKEVKAALKL